MYEQATIGVKKRNKGVARRSMSLMNKYPSLPHFSVVPPGQLDMLNDSKWLSLIYLALQIKHHFSKQD